MLVQFDARGQGLSTRSLGSDHTAESYIRDIDAVVDRLRLSRFTLVARNLFCQVAVQYALRRVERVNALVLSNPVRDLYEGFDDLRKQRWDLYTETIARLSNLPNQPSEIAAQFRQAVTQADHIKLVEALRWPETPLNLGMLQTATLIIDSATSPLHAHEWAAQLASAMPKAQLVSVHDESGGSGSFSAGSDVPAVVPVIENFIRRLPVDAAGRGAPQTLNLSTREIQVMRMVAQGLSNQQIADQLVISIRTVERHINHIYEKLNVRNRVQATAYAKDHGLA
jgi:DNA-binding CsgD family transcriptional regulator/pimeloyl-ACP methyl ester carboxylesterase